MTLKEKLRQNLTGHLSNDKTEVDVNIAAKIADDYAIEFAGWLMDCHVSELTLKEFKKQKGL